MPVKANHKFIRTAPRKIRLVVDVVRGMDVTAAADQLRNIQKGSAQEVLAVLDAAVANAKESYGFAADNLFIKDIRVDDGATLKRWRPRAQGRGFSILKRTAHLSIMLDEKVKSKGKKRRIAKAPQAVKLAGPVSAKRGKGSDQGTGAEKQGFFQKAREGFSKKMFRRKDNM